MMTFDSRVVSDVHVLTPRKNLVGGEETKALTSAVTELASSAVVRLSVRSGLPPTTTVGTPATASAMAAVSPAGPRPATTT